MIKSVTDYIRRAAILSGEKIAIIQQEKTLTFGELENYAVSIASYLINKFSDNRKPIVVFIDKEVYSIPCFMGIALSGNIYVPMDTKAPVERINKILEVLDPIAIVTDFANQKKTEQLKFDTKQIFIINDMLKSQLYVNLVKEREEKIIDTDPLYIVFTSGSTGTPKGVVVSHRSVIDFTEEVSKTMELTSKEKFISQAPFYFDVSVFDIYCMLRNCAQLHIIDQKLFSFPIRLLEYIHENDINAIFWVPSALILVANFRVLGKIDISCLKKVMFCGEAMPNKQLNLWRKYLPDAKFVNYYGPSETTCASTYYIINREFADNEPLPIGSAALNTNVLVLTEENTLVVEGEIGELCIRGSSLALGYYNNSEKTKEVFIQNPIQNKFTEIIYKTGDLVRYNQYQELEYIGRKDFQIKHMGFRIELGEIETAARGLLGVENCCCVYDSIHTMIVMFVQATISIDEIRKCLTEHIPTYMIPGRFILMDMLPMNANGKIDRVYLKTQL